MSGHSKWSSIKHRKAAVDSKRGKIFTKIIREITVAAKIGGPDPDANPRLRAAVLNARGQNMPNDTVARAIKKGSGGNDGVDYEEVTYEGFGPANVAVVVEALTDNRNRTIASIRTAFNKYNGSLGSSNSVLFMFDRKGSVLIPQSAIDEDSLTETVLEAGGEDLELIGEDYQIICSIEDFEVVKSAIDAKGLPVKESGLTHVPQNKTVISEKEDAEKVMNFIDMLEEDDDVQKVYTNFDIDDKLLAEFS